MRALLESPVHCYGTDPLGRPGCELVPDALHPEIAQVAHGGDAVAIPEVLQEGSARDARHTYQIGKRHRLRQISVDIVDDAPDITRCDRPVPPMDCIAIVAWLRKQQPVHDEGFELTGNQRIREYAAVEIEVDRGPAQHAGEAAAMLFLKLHGRIEAQWFGRRASQERGKVPVQRVAAD
jgi:hypothetical protein